MEGEQNSVMSCVVKDKIEPIFKCEHIKGTTTEKTGRDGEKYLATPNLNDEVLHLLQNGHACKVTAKVDGSSCLIMGNQLLKRRDRKPSWDKRSKKNVLKPMPATWIPTGVQTDTHGIGYMSLEKGDTWFFDVFKRDGNLGDENLGDENLGDENLGDENSVVDNIGHPLINGNRSTRVRIVTIEENKFVYKFVDLSELEGKSFEHLGPKVQGNPHGLKFHALMEHGLIECKTYPKIMTDSKPGELLDQIKAWHSTNPLGMAIEGVV